MDAHDEDFLVVGTVEDADLAPAGEAADATPEEIVLELGGARMLEARHLAPLGIDAAHHVLDHAVLAGAVHPLEHEQQRVSIRCVQELLQVAQSCGCVRSVFLSFRDTHPSWRLFEKENLCREEPLAPSEWRALFACRSNTQLRFIFSLSRLVEKRTFRLRAALFLQQGRDT